MAHLSFRRTATMLALVLPCAVAHAQRASYVTTLGTDTLAFEQFERMGDSIVGDWVTTYGGIGVHHYTIHLRPDGTVARYALSIHRLTGRVDGTTDLRFVGDSLIARGFDSTEQHLPLGNAVPTAAQTIAALNLVIAQASATRQASARVPVVSAFGPYRRGEMLVAFFGRDSVRLGDPRSPIWVTLDRDGRIMALSDRATCTREETRRVPNYDWHAIIKHFPDIPDTAALVGVPAISPRDTARATLGDAAITIDYGRPAVRGRDVFRNGVLGDTLWRVGANAPTQFVTTRDLIVGSETLPAGRYVLWVRAAPDNSNYTLLFNAQTGQAVVPMPPPQTTVAAQLTRRAASSPVERLTIRVAPGGAENELRIEWGMTALGAPIRLK